MRTSVCWRRCSYKHKQNAKTQIQAAKARKKFYFFSVLCALAACASLRFTSPIPVSRLLWEGAHSSNDKFFLMCRLCQMIKARLCVIGTIRYTGASLYFADVVEW